MKEYKIRKARRVGEEYETMVISERATGDHIAEYRLTRGHELSEMRGMTRAIDAHLSRPGATLKNYQW